MSECLLQRHRSAVACQGTEALAAADLGGTACESRHRGTEQSAHRLEVIIPRKSSHCCKSSSSHNRFPNLGIWQRNWAPPGNLTLKVRRIWLQNFHRTGETDPWRAQTKSCALTGPRRKQQWPHKETEPDLPVSVQVSPPEAWVERGLQWGQRHWLQQTWHKSFWRRSLLPYSSFVSGQTTEREHSPTHQQKIGFKIYWAWPRQSEQDPDSPTASPSHKEASTNILSLFLE